MKNQTHKMYAQILRMLDKKCKKYVTFLENKIMKNLGIPANKLNDEHMENKLSEA